MQVQLENLGQLRRRLDVTLPAEQIEAEVESRLKRLARTAKLHGFRPGKVPYKVVVQQFGPQVRQEVLGESVQRSFSEAVRGQNLRVAGFPEFEPRSEEGGDGAFSYSAIFEVYPDVALGDLSASTIARPVLQVSEAEVDRTIEILRKQRVAYEPVERAAAKDDRVVIDFSGTLDGAEFEGGKGEDMPLVLGEGRLLPEFEAAVTGMKAGESKSFDLTFPADYHAADLAGKKAVFQVTVKSVAGPRLPEVDAEFARSLGIEDGDLGRMRQDIRANLEREVKRRIQSRIKEQVMQALLDSSKPDLPKALIDAEVERLSQSARGDLQARGIAVGNAPLPAEMFEEQAKRRVGLALVMAEVVKANHLHAKPEQVRAIVEDFAQSYERPEEVVRWYYSEPQRLSDVEAVALEDNVVNWVLSKAKVTDTAVPFDELMGN